MKKELLKILKQCINSKNIELGSNLSPSQELINSKTIIWNDSLDTYNINFTNPIVNSILTEIAQERLKRELPNDIISTLKFIDDFEEDVKRPETNITWAGLIQLKNSLKVHLLANLHNEHNVDLVVFLDNLKNKESKRVKELYSFEDLFFKALPYLKINIETIFDIIKKKYPKKNYEPLINNFCRNLGFTNPALAHELFEFGKANGLNQIGVLTANLLVGLHNNGDNTAYEKAKNLFIDNEMLSIFFFGRAQLKTIQEINDAISIIEKIDKTNEQSIFELECFYENLLENELITEEITKYCFKKFNELFTIDNDNLRWRIIHTFSHSIKNYEIERYNFLLFALDTGKNPNYIKRYFHTYKDPKYFFDLFSYAYKNLGIRTNIELFEDDFIHFWNDFKESTENHILECLTNQNKLLRTGAIKLILNSRFTCHVNLLKIKKSEQQLRALEALTDFPHSIDNLISIILPLRKSKSSKVVQYLQNKLSTLIYDAYHEYLFNLIEKNIGVTQKDIDFIKPIKQTLEHYQKIKELKSSINDLNPWENERQHMDLYYRLEHENHAIMMNKIKEGKGTFLEFFGKSHIIVRGNSWKTDGDDDIRQLAKIEHSTVLDGRAYKNPDQFEHNLNNPKSLF
ncbi:hypothetical protein EQG63_11850 [Flavobacterium amnicola]|uniref:Uncharacterized protein n=1 Tax=Flavobacterium amnicola TaxID=2506422 RepID=A0A4Q1K345_9FLAO|nr:hypothetical protein [Flavobacterium amnicola]RXR16309.1 hypothetical protein EQG63_11850 [Flavobacterium amnicola]